MRFLFVFLVTIALFTAQSFANPHAELEQGVLLGDLESLDPNKPPSENFDLLDWHLTLPVDTNKDGKVDNINEVALSRGFEVKPLFYTGSDGGMVFICPHYGPRTSKKTKYVRTELREMLRRGDASHKTKGVTKNNWVFGTAHSSARKKAGGVNGSLEATLAVNRVSTTGERNKVGRVIIGQIHASDDEPIRLYYRKLPENELGSIYFAHEIPEGDDVYTNMVGNRSKSAESPEGGIALNEKFSYKITVIDDQLYVTLIREGKPNIDRHFDMSESKAYSRSGEYHYFKAGIYNQNNTGERNDLVKVTFYHLENTHDGYNPK